VFNQLIAAHEQGIIGNDSSVKLGESPDSGTGNVAVKLWLKSKKGAKYIDIKQIKWPLLQFQFV
jgi:hypothetical protein